IQGLQGGHSGMDIIKGLGNANKLMNGIVVRASEELDLRVASINVGGLRNAIRRESEAVVVIDKVQVNESKEMVENQKNHIIKEYVKLEPGLKIEMIKTRVPDSIMESGDQEILLKAVYAAHNGVYRMSPDIEGLVETSNNIARIGVKDGDVSIHCLTRSSVDASKRDLANALSSVFELAGYEVKLSGEYPGWTPNPDSDILKVMDELYERMNDKKANIAACHAGLECGIIGKN